MIVISILFLLVTYSLAGAQMTCTPAASGQACTVTVSWTNPGNPPTTNYVVERQDAAGAWASVGNTTGLALVNSFNDPGSTAHCYRVWAVDSQGQKAISTNAPCWTTPALEPPTYPTVPPQMNIAEPAPPIIWSLGKPTDPPGNFDILRNGARVQRAKGSKIAYCQEIIYVFGRDNLWWKFTTAGWAPTNSATLPCDKK